MVVACPPEQRQQLDGCAVLTMPRKLLKFLILFDNTSLLYFPGQFLSGRVLIELQDDTPALADFSYVASVAIGLTFSTINSMVTSKNKRNLGRPPKRWLGDIKRTVGTPWQQTAQKYVEETKKGLCVVVESLHFHVVGEGVVRVRSPRQERVYDRENYIDFRMRLLGEPGQAPSVLSPGIHSFPFKLGLPLGLPSTFLGKHGWVQYYCKTALKEPNGLTHKNQQVFIVMNPIDLNLEPSILSQAFRCEIEHRLGVSCVGSGPVVCRVTLDRGGYVPGESIGISASVHNRSNVTVKSTRAALTETIQYMARGKVVQSERRELACLTRGKIRPGESDEWTNEQLYVPPLPPTNLRGCHLIKIQYDVYFVIEPKSLEKEVKLQLPIMMATYPLRSEGNGTSYKAGTHYPSTLPIFRPWLEDKPVID